MDERDRKALEVAREAVGNVLEDAYNRAVLVCCRRPGYECCGSPVPEWSEADTKIMDVLEPIHKAIEERLQADEPKENPAPDWHMSVEQAYQEARLVYADYCDHTREALGYMRSVLIAKCVDGLPSRSQADHIRLPTSADEAELMAKVGMKWLEDNAPERLKQADEKEEPVAWRIWQADPGRYITLSITPWDDTPGFESHPLYAHGRKGANDF